MAIPGLSLAAPTQLDSDPDAVPETRLITLQAGSEWRFEVPFDTHITVTLLLNPTTTNDADHTNTNGNTSANTIPPGTAELCGTELAPGHTYTFTGAKSAIFTHSGCTLSVGGPGPCDSDYIAEETPMAEYANVHFALERLRDNAAEALASLEAMHSSASVSQFDNDAATGGPRVLVLGPPNAGKSTLAKMLTSYAARSGRSPCVVNLDPGEGMFAPPGSFSAAVFGADGVMDIEDAATGGWGGSPVTGGVAGGGTGTVGVKTPLVYQFGAAERVEEAPEWFKGICSRVAMAVTGRFEEDRAVKEAGILVDIGGSVVGARGGYEIVAHVVSEFSINLILILGSERLHSDMTRRYPQTSPRPPTRVLKLPKSGGCVDRDAPYMNQLRHHQIRTYFFGDARCTLSPHTQILDNSPPPQQQGVGAGAGWAGNRLEILRVVDPSENLEDAFLPGDPGDGANTHALTLQHTSPLPVGATHALLAIKHALPGDRTEVIRDAAVMGWLYVADVDEERKRVRVVSGMGGGWRGRAVVWGRWPEGVGLGA